MSDSKITSTCGCVSMSLYGESAKYAYGALQNVELVRQYYPGWQHRIYLERGHYAKAALEKAGASVVEMDGLPGSGGMFWRFLAVDDPQFTHVVIRDADSRIGPREAACVEEWLQSGKALHVMKDHPAHRQHAVIGGAFGLKSGGVRMAQEIYSWSHNFKYGDDEEFLHRRVWEFFKARSDFLYHDYQGLHTGLRFPTARGENEDHVCQPKAVDLALPGKCGAFVISPPHYAERLKIFYERLKNYGGMLSGMVRTWTGTTPASGVRPPVDFPRFADMPHYFYATYDHVNIWRKAQELDLDYLFVLEDDVTFIDGYDDYLARALMCVPAGWWAIQLGGQTWTERNRAWFTDDKGEIVFPKALARVRGCCGMHATLWSRDGYTEAIKHYDAMPLAIIDWEFMEWQKTCDMFYSPMRWINYCEARAQFGKDS